MLEPAETKLSVKGLKLETAMANVLGEMYVS